MADDTSPRGASMAKDTNMTPAGRRGPSGGYDAAEEALDLQASAARARALRAFWRFITGIVVAAFIAWLVRWDVTPVMPSSNHPPYVIALDRWTGDLFYVQQSTSVLVVPAKR